MLIKLTLDFKFVKYKHLIKQSLKMSTTYKIHETYDSLKKKKIHVIFDKLI